MVAFTFTMPGGIPGDLQRAESGFTAEPAPIDYLSPPTSYGIPVVVDATNLGVRGLINTDTAAYGVILRPYPLQAATASGFSGAVALGGGSTPPTKGICDVLKRNLKFDFIKGEFVGDIEANRMRFRANRETWRA